MKLNKLKLQKGFTIIEVMIVLAIAGLIMVIVFLAVPQLQRSQRNTTRKSVADRIKTEIDNYSSNNNGSLPTATALCAATAAGANSFGNANCATGFFGRYLGCPGTTPNWCTGNINDPQTGFAVGTGTGTAPPTTTYAAAGLTSTVPGSLNYATNVVCNGEGVTGGSARNYAFQMALEGGAVACLDNH